MTRPGLAKRSRRGGFTLIELLVVISIIAVLMSLIAPAVQNARRAARKIQCLNHMHNLAIATQNFATNANASLPQAWSTTSVGKSGNAAVSLTYYHNWTFSLLPLMDQAAVFNSIRQASLENGSTGVALLKTEDQVYIPGLVCPEDQNNVGRSLGLSYVANTGYINMNLWGGQSVGGSAYHDLFRVDYNLNTKYMDDAGAAVNSATTTDYSADATYAVATGVFWHNASASEPKVTLDSIGQGDGLTQTLMYAENQNANDWSSADPDTSCFGIAVDPEAPLASASSSNGYLYVAASSLPATFGNVTVSGQLYQSAKMNSQPLNGVGIPRPSSSHLGVVNVVFCDGSSRSLNDIIDVSVYVRLLSPDGKRYGQVLVNSTSY